MVCSTPIHPYLLYVSQPPILPPDEIGIPSLAGKDILSEETNQSVIDLLKQNGRLMHSHLYVHKYPYDWRSKTPVVIRATTQWFANVDQIKGSSSSFPFVFFLLLNQLCQKMQESAFGRLVPCRQMRQHSWGKSFRFLNSVFLFLLLLHFVMHSNLFFSQEMSGVFPGRGCGAFPSPFFMSQILLILLSMKKSWSMPSLSFPFLFPFPFPFSIILTSSFSRYVRNLIKEKGSDYWWSSETDNLLPGRKRVVTYSFFSFFNNIFQ